ncbi:hypothetical protein [Bradyrhizobium sp. RP6]|uniref:hypothetical protein n=1 Tax=Bradyrhizobium sp. RP6 TaxID=2489596 RepID=UPI000F52BF79|nr:hypothetical protein [Bradyrhizobium sp. RP6]RQH12694.1 hypothetical protein EHH60_14475 [Bradyrhizobium sp. RP6]
MATAPMRVSAPQSPYRDCDIAILDPEDAQESARALCTDVKTGVVVGAPPIAPRSKDEITPDEVIRMIGGTYRLAAIAVDIGTEELRKQTRRISEATALVASPTSKKA